jgi:hypothetical protein
LACPPQNGPLLNRHDAQEIDVCLLAPGSVVNLGTDAEGGRDGSRSESVDTSSVVPVYPRSPSSRERP